MPKLLRLQLLPLYIIVASVGLGGLGVRYQDKLAGQFKPVDCRQAGRHIRIELTPEGFWPRQVQGRLCDRLSFVNESASRRIIAFGPHEKHVAYPGYVERPLKHGQAHSLMLTVPGEYRFHDHYNESIQGTIIIPR